VDIQITFTAKIMYIQS